MAPSLHQTFNSFYNKTFKYSIQHGAAKKKKKKKKKKPMEF